MQPLAKNQSKTWVPETIEKFHNSTFEGSRVGDAPWDVRRKAALTTFRFGDYVTPPDLISIEASNSLGRRTAEWVDSAPPEKKALYAEGATRGSTVALLILGMAAGFSVGGPLGLAIGSLAAQGVTYGIRPFLLNPMLVAAGCEKTPEEISLLGEALGGPERFNALPLYQGAPSIAEITKESVTAPVMRGMLLRFPEGKRKDRPRLVPFVIVQLQDKKRTTILFRESLKYRRFVAKAIGGGGVGGVKVLEYLSWERFSAMVVPLLQGEQGR